MGRRVNRCPFCIIKPNARLAGPFKLTKFARLRH